MKDLAIIPLLPLAAAIVLFLCPNLPRLVAAAFAIGGVGGSLVYSIKAFLVTLHSQSPMAWNFEWFHSGEETVAFGFLLDPMSGTMAVVVSLISLLVLIYSVSYMREDPRFGSFFRSLALFIGAMLGVVL